MKYFKLFFNKQFMRFAIVGVINTIIGISLMFCFYNLFDLGYWKSTFLANLLASVLSFFLNKNFTFQSKSSLVKSVKRFVIVIIFCYIIAYLIAENLILYGFQMIDFNIGTHAIEQIAMLLGAFVFTILNFIGQNFFAFRGSEND